MSRDQDDSPARRAAPRVGAEPRARQAEPAALPDVSRDEQDVGWGDEPDGRDEDWYRRERPPHHE